MKNICVLFHPLFFLILNFYLLYRIFHPVYTHTHIYIYIYIYIVHIHICIYKELAKSQERKHLRTVLEENTRFYLLLTGALSVIEEVVLFYQEGMCV